MVGGVGVEQPIQLLKILLDVMTVKILESHITTKKLVNANVCKNVHVKVPSMLGMITLHVDANANILFLALNQNSLVGKAVNVNVNPFVVQKDMFKAHKVVFV